MRREGGILINGLRKRFEIRHVIAEPFAVLSLVRIEHGKLISRHAPPLLPQAFEDLARFESRVRNHHTFDSEPVCQLPGSEDASGVILSDEGSIHELVLFLQCFRKQEMPSLENREKRFHSLPGSSFCGSSQAGERDAKATALTQCAFDLNLSSVLLHDALCNSEAQARAGLEARVFCPVEALKNPG